MLDNPVLLVFHCNGVSIGDGRYFRELEEIAFLGNAECLHRRDVDVWGDIALGGKVFILGGGVAERPLLPNSGQMGL